jgi:hypothetical protein
MNTVKVEGIDVLSIGLDKTQQTIATGPNQGSPYWRARYQGRGFIITDEQFLREFEAGNVAMVSLAESEYQVEDPLNPGEKITRPSYNMVSYATYTQVTRIAEQQGKLDLGKKRFDIEMQVLEKKALAELKLDDQQVGKLQDAI